MSKQPRGKALLKAYAKHWTPFQQVEITAQMRDEYVLLKNCHAIYSNSRFEVQLFAIETPIGGVMQATFHRHGDIEQASWEDLQRSVHELFGPEAVAIEIFPSMESEWHTKSGVRVLWILPSTWRLPFGLEFDNSWGRKNG